MNFPNLLTLLRIFFPDIVKKLWGMQSGMALESRLISRTLETAQKRMEAHNFDIRKNLVEYDEVMNNQRKIIYGQRQRVMEAKDLKEMIIDMIKDRIYHAIDLYLPKDARESAWDYAGLYAWAKRKFGIELAPDELNAKDIEQTEELLIGKVKAVYEEREKILTAPMMREIEQYLLLQKIDEKWKDHLYATDHLRSGIGLRGYAQVDPKIEYKREAFQMFTQLIESIKEETTELIFRVRAERPETEKL